ncbi:MAG: monovalent cation/H(+) antiporter subunit G [Planctomycetes bacterium]|nr:monovalent cation/H(+) antiporter subunit G [Planctomycetota bacterium]
MLELASSLFVAAGLVFFVAGTAGLLRFPDALTRLHALTKADNLGLGLLFVGLALRAASWSVAVRLLVVWLLVLFASTTACHLVARAALEARRPPRG